MRVTIYQPQYFPRLHYFNRILNADVFVILESAQYTKALTHVMGETRERHKSYQADSPIKLPVGIYFLTVPVKKEQSYLPINEVVISYQEPWNKKHLATMKNAYAKTKRFHEIFPQVKTLLLQEYQTLSQLTIQTILWGIATIAGMPLPVENITLETINQQLATQKKIRLKKVIANASLAAGRPEGRQKGTEWTTAICEALHANEYLHGETAKNGYMDLEYYKAHNIRLVAQQWECQEYPQRFYEQQGFIPNLSLLDLVFNTDPDMTRKVIGIM